MVRAVNATPRPAFSDPPSANPFNVFDTRNWRGDHFLRTSVITAGYLLAGTAGLRGLRWLFRSRAIDPAGFHNPELGSQLTTLFFNPGSVRAERSLGAPVKAKIEETIEKIVALVSYDRGRYLSGGEAGEVRKALQARLEAFCRLVARPEPFLEGLPGVFQNSFMINMRSGLWSPMEHTLNQLHGSIYYYARWGIIGNEALSEVFISTHIFQGTLQGRGIRRLIGEGFAIDKLPGTMESTGGLLHRLVWVGFRDPFKETGIELMRVGFVRRPDGFAVTCAQGGRIGRQRVTLADGREVSLLWYARSRFGDLHLWLSRQVLRQLSQQDPQAKFYWLKGEANFWFYSGFSTSPLDSATSLQNLAGILGPRSMRELLALRLREVRRARATIKGVARERPLEYSEALALDSYQYELRTAIECVRPRRRMNNLAQSLGFDPADEHSCWALLRPGDVGWSALQRRQPTDLL